jgi:methanogenic corrinoid protein MtbC1
VGDALYGALVEDRAEEARSLIVSAYMDGARLGWLFDGPVREALTRIGELWGHDPDGILLEHRATETCLHALEQLRELISEPASSAPLALGGGFQGDVYRVPSAMAELVLAESGFRVLNLGPDTPVAALFAGIRRYGPQMVWLSLSISPEQPSGAASEIARLADALDSGTVVVGGRGSETLPAIQHPRVRLLGGMTELSAYARGAVDLPTATPR